MNKVILTGRLSKDPEVRYTQNGKAVASFDIAVDDGFGENKKTYFFPIVAWEKLAEICGNNLSKGRKVLVEGKLSTRTYETQDGQKRRVTEVIAQNVEFMDGKKTSSGEPSPMDSLGTEVFPEEEIIPF